VPRSVLASIPISLAGPVSQCKTWLLTIYNGTTAVGSFSLAASLKPLTFSAADLALQQGNGNAVFNFQLDATEQGQFNAIVALAGSSGFFAGLGSSLGCAAGAPAGCLVSNDGPDSFIGFVESGQPVVRSRERCCLRNRHARRGGIRKEEASPLRTAALRGPW